MANREMFHNNQPQPTPDTGMSVDEAAFCMDLIHSFCESTFDHSWASLLPVIGLLKTLLERPEDFWTEWEAATCGDHNRELRDQSTAYVMGANFDPHSMEQLKAFTGAR